MRLGTIINRDALCALRELPAESVHCCVTSPPYYALRDYGMDAQIGREDTPEQYIARLVEVFRELKRVLRPDGTFWLNIADTYCGTGSKGAYTDPKNPKGRNGQSLSLARRAAGCKQKDLIGIPWLLAFGLHLQWAAILSGYLLPLVFSAFIGVAGCIANLLFPSFDWENATYIVKRSIPAILNALMSMALSCGGFYILIKHFPKHLFIGNAVIILIVVGLTAAAILWLKEKGEILYRKL
jgi:hypothetical protein